MAPYLSYRRLKLEKPHRQSGLNDFAFSQIVPWMSANKRLAIGGDRCDTHLIAAKFGIGDRETGRAPPSFEEWSDRCPKGS
jgi:hypothetical protein